MGKRVTKTAGIVIACVLAAGAAVAQFTELPAGLQAGLAALAAVAGTLGVNVHPTPPGEKDNG